MPVHAWFIVKTPLIRRFEFPGHTGAENHEVGQKGTRSMRTGGEEDGMKCPNGMADEFSTCESVFDLVLSIPIRPYDRTVH